MRIIYKIKPNKLPTSASRGLLLAIDLGAIHCGPIECTIIFTEGESQLPSSSVWTEYPRASELIYTVSLTQNTSLPEMLSHQEKSWEAKAKAKVAETKSKIPKEWRLNQSSLDKAKQIKKLSGPFIESFLSDEEISITRNDSTLLVEKVKTGEYTALQVAQAFCKTAAIAHQIVSIIC